MNTFIRTKIFDNARVNPITLDSFKTVSNAWIGAFMSEVDYNTTEEYALIKTLFQNTKKLMVRNHTSKAPTMVT